MNDRFNIRYFNKNSKKFEYLKIGAVNFNLFTDWTVYEQGQFCTGLKDKNGTLIYEGDIMNVLIDSFKPHYIKQVVVWDRKEWQLKTFNKDYRKNCSECGRQLRTKCKCCSEYFSATGHTNFKEFYNGIVIGNIYENKELLNEQ